MANWGLSTCEMYSRQGNIIKHLSIDLDVQMIGAPASQYAPPNTTAHTGLKYAAPNFKIKQKIPPFATVAVLVHWHVPMPSGQQDTRDEASWLAGNKMGGGFRIMQERRPHEA